MGYGTYDSSASQQRAAVRQATGQTAFQHNVAAQAGHVAALHPSLDPKQKMVRECFDNNDNPTSTPIGIFVDVTGSMGQISNNCIDSLHKMMAALSGYPEVKFPQVCFGAIGDGPRGDRVPIQIGEFEASDELTEQHLSNIYIEGGGWGNGMESYDMALWFFANYVHTDAWNKRGEKGFLFLIADEAPYPYIYRDTILEHFGVDINENIPLDVVTTQLQKQWDVFIIRPGGSTYFDHQPTIDAWKKVIPSERVIQAEDWEQIVPMIAGTIAVMSGISTDQIVDALKASGFDSSVVDKNTTALAQLSGTTGLVAATGDLVGAGGATSERL